MTWLAVSKTLRAAGLRPVSARVPRALVDVPMGSVGVRPAHAAASCLRQHRAPRNDGHEVAAKEVT